ncbi:unnamed protein product [Phytophthora fragariaefolia]|uniref:Unnamed protein product n=1 Tax=Phytophthora fragariaefolia TaxID=1490495 RepID=A0A9W6X6M8_9STRA|nr:unnamed protein product [Phytophthora fragariaefolia]
MGFTYAPVIHDSQLYNPLFYSYLGSDGSLTYAYAQTLFLSRNDYRVSYLSGITLGIATEGLALVPGSGGNISGIGALGCSSLTVNGSSVLPPPSYVIGITEGSATASKALVLDSMLDISGINSLSATNLSGTLQTAAQPNITSLGTLTSITTSGALSMGGISISSSEISVLDSVSPGTAAPPKALVLNSSLIISGIASLSTTTLSGTLQTAAQPNITSVGTLTSLALSGGISGVTSISASGTINFNGVVNCNNSTYAASPLSGSLVVSGGVGIQKNIAIGGIASASSQWGALGVQYQSRATTYTDTSSLAGSTVASSVISSYAQPTIASTNSITTTRAATVYIENSVAGSTNTTITNSNSLWIASDKVLFDDTTASSSVATGALVVSGGIGVGGQLTASTIAGTIQAAAQPNITSIGTLASLSVSGALTASTIAGINNLNPTYDLDVVGQTRITGTLLFAGTTRTISNVAAYGGGTITTSGDITCGGSLKGYLDYGNQSTITTVGVLTEVAIGSTGVYNSQEYLLITGNGSNYLDGSYTRMCSFYGSNVTPAWLQIEVSNGSKTVSTSATWIGNNSDTDLRFGTNNNPSGTGVAYFLKSGGLISSLGPLSPIPIGIGTVGAILAGSGCYTTSDARIKKDWTELSDDVCDAMLQIRPLLFRYKSDDQSVPLQLGYKAQDLLRANISHCINFTPNAEMHVEDREVDTEGIQYSIDYSKVVCLLHQLVLRQQREINDLKSLMYG